jgi:hypothetical protein
VNADLAAAAADHGLAPLVAALTAQDVDAVVEDTGGGCLALVVAADGGHVAVTSDDGGATYLVGRYAGTAWVDGGDPVGIVTVRGAARVTLAVHAGLDDLEPAKQAVGDVPRVVTDPAGCA